MYRVYMKTIIFLLLIIPSYVFAGGTYVGKIQPYFYSGGLYLIPVDSAKSSLPDCITRHYVKLPDAVGTPEFSAKYSMILAAWMSGKEMTLVGTGKCTSEGDEIILTMLINKT
jgi:hypothetical protein